MSRSSRRFSAVRTEGGLLPHDILTRIQRGDPDLTGTAAGTYHLGPNERIGEAANRAWSRMVAIWRAFQEALEKESDTSLATGVTRERWLLPLFQELGYGRLTKGTAIEVEGKSYAVSHTWHHSPIHLLGCRVDLDTRQKGVAGAAMSSPHGLVQDFLNRSDAHLWGFVTNGYQLRVLRDHHSLTRQAYVEFDLQAIMDGEQYSEFLLLWLVCHQSRVEADKPEECWLETWVNISRDEGVRALDKLRDGVEKAIEAFGTGFLAHKANTRLKAALESGELDSQEYYRQVLRLVYRLIFLFVAEERDALLDPNATEEARERYRRYYATRRIRDLADKRRGSPHGDLWRGIALVMEKLDDGYPELGLPALGSMLWGKEACPWLMDAECANEHVLTAVRLLSHIQDGKTRYPVNWRNVGADELGSIYEGLLELHPRMNKEAGTFELDTAAGHERKTTGSYYTPTSLVDCLLGSALDPVLERACMTPEPEQAILDLKICDPACGSGHFLVAAARRVAKRLASVRSGDDEPGPRAIQRALRDVVGRCTYGVDLNPMAVELCKVSLWLEALDPGKPLSFLDNHIQCGNALLGATPALMSRGIPDAAFKPIEGDDKDVATRLKKRNKEERRGQTTLFDLFSAQSEAEHSELASEAQFVEEEADDSIRAVREKERRWGALSQSAQFQNAWFRADAWCATFIWPKQPGDLENAAITQDAWLRIEEGASVTSQLARRTVRDLADEYQFFHWHLAFPQVFVRAQTEIKADSTTGWIGGFDVVLGNPPWERVNIEEKEWFSERSPEVASAKTGAARKKLIQELEGTDSVLFAEFRSAVRFYQATAQLLAATERYPLCARGRLNTYALFSELNCTLVQSAGRCGFLVPSGIATDSNTQYFFSDLNAASRLVALYSFENEEFIFPAVHHAFKFCLLTISGSDGVLDPAEFIFFARKVQDLADRSRLFSLSRSDIDLLNPNTGTCPIFRSRRDAEITKAIYQKHPVFIKESSGAAGNPWSVSFKQGHFNMTSDSHLFRLRSVLEEEGATLRGNTFESQSGSYVPLYEGKMIWHFDSRFGTYDGQTKAQANQGKLPELDTEQHQDPQNVPLPRYWVPSSEMSTANSSGPLVVFRDVTSSVVLRTSIFAIVPSVACGNNLPFVESPNFEISELAHVSSACSSLAFDYVTRQKLGGSHMNFFVLKQLPVISPEHLVENLGWSAGNFVDWFLPRILELTYTSWDLEAFALACGCDSPPFRWGEERRFLLRCEMDAAYFHLYLGPPNDWGETSSDLCDIFPRPRDAVDYIMETFPILKRKDEATYGDYRTKLQILEIYDAMQTAIDGGEQYETLLHPVPADPRLAHPESTRPDWAKVPQ